MCARFAVLLFAVSGTLHAEDAKVRTPREEAEMQLSMANALYSRGMFPQATQAFESFFKMPESYIHEKRHEALYRCGECLIKLNKNSEAVGRYDTLIRNYENSNFYNNALFRRGTLRFLLKDPGRAIDDLEALNKRLPEDKTATPQLIDSTKYFLGLAYMAKNRLQEARPHLDIVSKNKASEHRREALKYLADLDFRLEDWEKAILDYEIYRKDFPDKEEFPLIDYRLGRAYRELKIYDKAIAALRRIPPKHEYHTEAMSIEIDSFYQKEQFTEVLQSFARLEQVYPTDSEFRKDEAYSALLYMAGISHFKLKQYKDVVRRFTSLKDSFPKHSKLETALFLNCMSQYYLEDKDGAAAASKLFLETFPESKEYLSDVRYIYGDSLFALKRYKEALPFLQVIPEASEFHEAATLRIALCYNRLAEEENAEQEANLLSAAQAYDTFVKKFPEAAPSADSVMTSAVIYQRLKKFPQAEQRFNQFLVSYVAKASAETLEYAMYSRGHCQHAQNKFEAMATSFAMLLRSFPKTKHAIHCHYWIAIHYEKIGDWEKAAMNFLPVTRQKDHVYSDDAIRRLAVCHYKAKKLDAAADTFYTIFKERPSIRLPDNFGSWLAKHFAENGKVDDAIWVYEYLLKTRPETKYKTEFQYMLHSHYYNKKDFKKSGDWGAALLTALEESPDLRINKAKLLFQTGFCFQQDSIKDYKKAESYFLQLLDEKTSSELMNETEFWLGKVYRRSGEYKKALQYLYKIGLLMPTFAAEAQYEAGLCLIEMANPQKTDIQAAIPHLESLVKLWEGTGKLGLIKEYPDFEKIEEVKNLLNEAKDRLVKYKGK